MQRDRCRSVRYLSVNELEILISREQIAERVAEIGEADFG